MRTKITLGSMLITALLALPMVSSSAIITNTVENTDWNAAIWGSGPSTPSSGNDYVVGTSGYPSIRIGADGSSSTFGGDNLTFADGTALIKAGPGTTSTVTGNIWFDGGALRNGPNSAGDNTLATTQFIIAGGGGLIANSRLIPSLTLDGTLTGSGDLTLNIYNPDGTTGGAMVITDVSGYTGAITVAGYLDVEFGVDYTFTGGFDLSEAGSQLVVNSGQTLTFAEGSLSDTNGVVAAGIYSGASLDALGANYINNGGTVVVIPEPATISLIAIMGGGLMFIRRRFML